MNTAATASDSRLLVWAILARAVLRPVPEAHAVFRYLRTIRETADRIAGQCLHPGSRATVGELAARDLDRASEIGARLLTRDDLDWAALGFDDLDAADVAPVAVWVRGNGPIHTDAAPRVGVVGARASTERGERITREITVALADHGCHIVSGGAYGVDATAHRAALARSAATTIVAATGLDRVYPHTHQKLFEAVAESGTVISEYPPGTGTSRDRFPRRNRLIAALSQLLVIPEAGQRSGTLNAAGWGHQLRRPILAVPGPATAAASAGCHRLISDNHARVVTTVTEVIAAVDAATRTRP
ncbi:DNA-processing protein DprA [Nocardia nepalensis]|uniref:DNA-processing protein DprA n=1 Tax=Nocardia nepalensis TaxID=3375448 RepID=UPI003B6758FC